jgi:beta-lactamase regulating signal transducer with metallopeptidase domain
MASELLSHLLLACVAASIAILLVLPLRWLLRKAFGAGLAYQAWSMVPTLIAVALLPPMAVAHRPAVAVVLQASASSLSAPVAYADPHWGALLLAAWLAGAITLALWFWRAHSAFVRTLGPLTARGDLFYSASPHAGPVLLGLFRPKVVVPADFTQRYTAREQELIIAHESVHARRADVLVNLLQAFLQCLFWFNPLVHLAATFFRADQEMACDAAVLRKHPDARRTYAQALLKSHTFSTAAPITVACSWRFKHPVKERFMTLQQNPPRATRRFAGRVLVASLIAGFGYAGLAARAGGAVSPAGPQYDVVFSVKESDGGAVRVEAAEMLKREGEKAPHLITASGEKFAIQQGKWRAEFVITPVSAADKTFKLAGNVTTGDQSFRPKLVGRLGEKMGVSVGGPDTRFDLALLVTEAGLPPAKPGQ